MGKIAWKASSISKVLKLNILRFVTKNYLFYASPRSIRPCRRRKWAGQCAAWPYDRSDRERARVRTMRTFKVITLIQNRMRLINLYTWGWLSISFSRRMGNLTSTEPTMFWILKSLNLACQPNFWMTRAYFRAASRDSFSDLAPWK